MNSPLIKKLCGALDKISEFKAKKRTFIIVFLLYIVLLSVVSVFHEPWFDEAQAWQIARCASLRDILFKVPHYEGHPPLWHLLLVPFAKTGMPYEFSLSFVNIFFSAAAVWVIMFKTKLPDLMRLGLPFTYFFFYQYGVISRPYSVMALALMLCGIFYREKTQKPVRMVLSLALLCLSSAYGLAIAAGICVVWLIEEWNGKNIFKFIKEFVPTRAFFSLLGLLILAITILAMIMPYKETAAVSVRSVDGFGKNLLYILFILPFDATIGSVLTDDLFVSFHITDIIYIPLSAAVVFVLYLFGKKHENLKLLVIPYVILIPLLTLYMCAHHMGVITLYIIFWLCTCVDNGKPEADPGKHEDIIHRIFTLSACFFIVVQISWSVISSVEDIRYNYAEGRAMADYIKENNLENANIMSAWHAISIGGDTETKYYVFNSSSSGTTILPYFDHNIFINFNEGRNDMGYNEHKTILDEDEYAKSIEQFVELGTPEYVFGSMERGDSPLENIDGHFYRIVDDIEYCQIFKGFYRKGYAAIYKFEDIENTVKEVPQNEGTD